MITEEILKDIVEMLDIFGPVTLEEMSGIRLMNRTDTKYLLPLETLAVLLHYAAADYRVQEVAGERNIVYHTCLSGYCRQSNVSGTSKRTGGT